VQGAWQRPRLVPRLSQLNPWGEGTETSGTHLSHSVLGSGHRTLILASRKQEPIL
jgi:hypothetical protein